MASGTSLRRASVTPSQRQRMQVGQVLAFLAVALALITAVLSMAHGVTGSPLGGPTVPAVVAARTIPAGSPITADMLKIAQIPASLWNAAYYHATAKLVGGSARVDVSAGTILTSDELDTS